MKYCSITTAELAKLCSYATDVVAKSMFDRTNGMKGNINKWHEGDAYGLSIHTSTRRRNPWVRSNESDGQTFSLQLRRQPAPGHYARNEVKFHALRAGDARPSKDKSSVPEGPHGKIRSIKTLLSRCVT